MFHDEPSGNSNPSIHVGAIILILLFCSVVL